LLVNKSTHGIAVIGCGYWGKNLVRSFSELGHLVAVCDGDESVARKYAEQYGVNYRTFNDVLADKDIKGVVIATPAKTHASIVEQSLLANKHVFVEKPIALDIKDAEKLHEISKSSGQVLMVGHLLQYHPVFLKLKELVGAGKLGRLQHIYSHRLNFGKVRLEENILWSFAPHDISMILSLMGSEPESVSAIGSYYLHSKIADVTTTHLQFSGGQNAHVFVSWLHPYKEQKLVVVGDKGMAVFDDTCDWENKLLLYPHSISWKNGEPIPDKADAESIKIEQEEPLKAEAQHFLDCISKGQSFCRTGSDEAIRVLRVLQASEKAMRENRTISMSEMRASDDKNNGLDYFIHESSLIDKDVKIGKGTKVWHFSHILSGSEIGSDCVLGQNVMVGPNVSIGKNCKIQNNVSVYKGVIIEDGVFCGPSCVFTNVNNPRAEIEKKDEFETTVVRHGVTIGANSTIVCGVELGSYSFIAAGAVVTSNVPAFGLMAGVPAKQIGWVSHSGERLDAKLNCPKTGRKYKLTEADRLEEI